MQDRNDRKYFGIEYSGNGGMPYPRKSQKLDAVRLLDEAYLSPINGYNSQISMNFESSEIPKIGRRSFTGSSSLSPSILKIDKNNQLIESTSTTLIDYSALKVPPTKPQFINTNEPS